MNDRSQSCGVTHPAQEGFVEGTASGFGKRKEKHSIDRRHRVIKNTQGAFLLETGVIEGFGIFFLENGQGHGRYRCFDQHFHAVGGHIQQINMLHRTAQVDGQGGLRRDAIGLEMKVGSGNGLVTGKTQICVGYAYV